MIKAPGLVGLALLVAAACSSPGSQPTSSAPREEASSRGTPKRIVAMIRGTPSSLAQQKTNRSVGSVPGLEAIEELTTAGLVHADEKGTLYPQLAGQVPTIENGLWKLLPDGRMETSWKIKSAARWHDGTPVTSADLVFGATIEQDPDLGIPRNTAFDLIEAIETPDAASIVVRWNQPYIEADLMFSYLMALPLPRHLLAQAYADDKTSFFSLPYWTDGFVGAGPFRMKSWATDAHVILQAYDGYVLGRPKIDEIEVRFITDPNTMTANLLAGAIDLTMSRALIPVEQAQEILNQRSELRATGSFRSWYPIHSQFINSNPTVVTDVRFRRAMLQAIDRQQLVDSLANGQSFVAHSLIAPDLAEFGAVQDALVRYEYDPRGAGEAIGALGYSRGADGVFVDSGGQRLAVQIYTTTRSEIQPKIVLAVADYWKAIGVDVDPVMIPPQRISDREYRAQFPAFEMVSGATSASSTDVRRFHSASAPLPENRFTATGNNPRYRNPEMDRWIDLYVTTVPRTERVEALRQFLHIQTDQLPSMGLFYEVDFTLTNSRLIGPYARGPLSSQAWNAETWELKG